MGRDDNKAIPGLQGGRAPARAFHDFMQRAVASRPAENFEIAVQMPEWAVSEPDEQTWFEAPDNGVMVNPDGSGPPGGFQPLPPRQDEALPSSDQGERLDQDFIDRAIDRDRERERFERIRDRERERERERREERRRDPDLAPPVDRRSDRSADPME
jgi:penicillin-binding protein 1A